MRQKLHVIYVTGLGDRDPKGQRLAVSTWKWWGVKPELYQMNWGDGTPWETKFEGIVRRIDELQTDGKRVAMVGASAGASVVINAMAVRPEIIGAVLIAPKINRAGNVGERYKKNSPAFWVSIQECQQSLKQLTAEQKQSIQSRYALIDEVVDKEDSIIEGGHNKRTMSVGHFATIGIELLAAPLWLPFLKHQPKIK